MTSVLTMISVHCIIICSFAAAVHVVVSILPVLHCYHWTVRLVDFVSDDVCISTVCSETERRSHEYETFIWTLQYLSNTQMITSKTSPF